MATKKVEEKEKRIRAFASVGKHWSETLQDPSATLNTPFGQLFVYLHRIQNTNYDGFRPNIHPFFPYGLNTISTTGGLYSMHLYFNAIMDEKVADPHKRKHYLLTLYLPKLKTLFAGADTFHFGMENRMFEDFYLKPLPPKEKKSIKFEGSVVEVLEPAHAGFGGLIVIPDDLNLTRAIEVSIQEISQNEWKKGPWSFREMIIETEMAFRERVEERNRQNVPPPGWRDRLIN